MSGTKESEPTNENGEGLGQVVIEKFVSVRRVLNKGQERFGLRGNPQNTDLQEAVGWLATPQLVELIVGEPLERFEGQGTERLKASADLWSDEETARKLYTLAYSAYVNAQNNEINELLSGKRVTVSASSENQRVAIRYSDGFFDTSGTSPREVSGTFMQADVNTGLIMLNVDNPTDEKKYWIINFFEPRGLTQLVDVRIEEGGL